MTDLENLQNRLTDVCDRWGPQQRTPYRHFLQDLRRLLEAYGTVVLSHQRLPDIRYQEKEPEPDRR